MTLEQLTNLSDDELNRLAGQQILGWSLTGLGTWQMANGELTSQRNYRPATDRNQSGELLAKAMSNSLLVVQIAITDNHSEIRWWMPTMPLNSWNIVPGNSPRSETIAALLAAFAMEDKDND